MPTTSRERIRSGVTISDVAKRAGVSRATVSFVMNDVTTISISEATRDLVRSAARELGYRPNAAAKSLVTKRSNLIGFVTDQIATTPFAGQMIEGAQDAAWEAGKLILLVNSAGNPEIETKALETMLEHKVDGLVYASMYHRPVVPPESLFEAHAVLLDCFDAEERLSCIIPDEEGGGYTATKTLIEAGHRSIAFANNQEEIPATAGRLRGYLRALAEHDIEPDPSLIVTARAEASGGYDAALTLMSRLPRPTALFCFNDRMAMGAYDALNKQGLRIPEDVAIVGFDNQELISAQLHPGLTTVALPHYAMGYRAIQLLLREVEESSSEARTYIESCPLVPRNSV